MAKLFEVRNMDCPILWIRADPNHETLRHAKVYQPKKCWLFQLLLEKDILG